MINIGRAGKKVEVIFEHSEGLYKKGKKLEHFEIAGEDSLFYPAEARIKNDKVILTTDKVKNPKRVRYAWSNTTVANLFNSAGLPASSFISD